MDEITLDTNAWRDWAWCEEATSDIRHGNDQTKKAKLKWEFATLRDLRSQGQCEIANPIQIYLDFKESDWQLPDDLQKFINNNSDKSLPSLSVFPMTFPFILIDKDEYEKLFKSIFSHLKIGDNKYLSSRVDTTLLYTHILAKRDFYITSDKVVIRSQIPLKDDYKVTVMTLEDYLSMKTT